MIQTSYDIALSQIGDYDTDAIKKAFYEMAWIESGNIADRKQDDKEDGLARGKYQYEPESAKTALNRFKNWYESTKPFKLEGAYEEAIRRLEEKDYDFSTLDPDYQDVFNLINHQQNPKTSMADLSSGKISSMDFWINYHATLKGTTRDKRIEEWQSRIGDIPPMGSVVSPNISRGQTVDSFVSIDPKRQLSLEQNRKGNETTKFRPDGIIGMDTPYGQFTGDIKNKELSYVGGDVSAYVNPEGYGGKYDINENTSFVAKRRPAKGGGDESFVGLQYNKQFQEGGEVEQPSLTSPVLPNQTVQPTGFVDNIPSANTVDTTQGFYSVNPAPGESTTDFRTRTASQFNTNVVNTTTDTSSFKPPKSYVSPRISNPFMGGSSKSTTLDYTDTSGLTSTIDFPTDSGLSESELATLTVLGTASDVAAGESAKGVTEVKPLFSVSTFDPNNPRASDSIFDISDSVVETAFETWYGGGRRFNLKDGLAVIEGDVFNISDIVGKYDTKAFKALKGAVMRDPDTGQPWASDDEFNEWLKTQEAEVDVTQLSPEGSIRNTIAKLGDTHLFTLQDGTYSVKLKDLYDEFTAAILVGAVTGDAGKAAIAGGTQFIKTEVIESYALKAAEAAGGVGTAAGDAIAKKWRGFGGAATSIAGVLALGGDEEAALTAGVQHLVTEYGAEAVGEFIGGGEALGGATIAAVVSFLRTGDVEQAAISGATSYLFSVNPVLGIAAMALQFLTAKKPSYKSGYASFDFDEFKMNTYSQGDYDPSKANPSNVEFSKKLLNPMMPYIQELEKTTGFDFKGDLQIHYSQGKKGAGVYYTIGNRDQEGLSAREMFLNRLDYYDGKDQSTQDGGKVYRRHFQATKEGLEALYEALYADLAYIAENKITDLTHYTGVVKSAEEVQAGLKNTGFDMSSLSFMQDGGKILDKNTKVLYNSNQAKNYGLVDRKGKAPPSARADDVPMTLKEGDFVLSQPAVALYGEDTINRMVQRAANEAGTNLKSGGKVPVNVHNGEYIIPKKLTEYIGSNVLENMNNRGLMSVGERPNT